MSETDEARTRAGADQTADEPLEGEIVDDGGEPGGGGTDPGRGAGGVTFTATAFTEAAPEHRDRSAVTFGSVLVTVGLVLLAGRFSDTVAAGGPALWIGLGFLTWWAFSGNFGLLVPAGVLTGLGAGLMLGDAGFYGNAAALGLGAGFIAVYALDALRRRVSSNWWPLVPGVILVLVGLLQNTDAWGSLGDLGWPLLLIVVGIVIVGVALSRRGVRR